MSHDFLFWHRHLCHPGYPVLKKMIRENLVTGLKIVEGVTLCHMILYSVTLLFDLIFLSISEGHLTCLHKPSKFPY